MVAQSDILVCLLPLTADTEGEWSGRWQLLSKRRVCRSCRDLVGQHLPTAGRLVCLPEVRTQLCAARPALSCAGSYCSCILHHST
jgi:hypothetical protein